MIQLCKKAPEYDKRNFLRMYIYFKALKMNLKTSLTSLIELDGTILTEKAEEQLLIVVGQLFLSYSIRCGRQRNQKDLNLIHATSSAFT